MLDTHKLLECLRLQQMSHQKGWGGCPEITQEGKNISSRTPLTELLIEEGGKFIGSLKIIIFTSNEDKSFEYPICLINSWLLVLLKLFLKYVFLYFDFSIIVIWFARVLVCCVCVMSNFLIHNLILWTANVMNCTWDVAQHLLWVKGLLQSYLVIFWIQ